MEAANLNANKLKGIEVFCRIVQELIGDILTLCQKIDIRLFMFSPALWYE